MKHSRRDLLLAFGGVLSCARFAGVCAQDFASYSDADREAFLVGGTVVSVRDIGEGVTKPIQAELSWKGVMTRASGATWKNRSTGAGSRGKRRGFAHAYSVCL